MSLYCTDIARFWVCCVGACTAFDVRVQWLNRCSLELLHRAEFKIKKNLSTIQHVVLVSKVPYLLNSPLCAKYSTLISVRSGLLIREIVLFFKVKKSFISLALLDFECIVNAFQGMTSKVFSKRRLILTS